MPAQTDRFDPKIFRMCTLLSVCIDVISSILWFGTVGFRDTPTGLNLFLGTVALFQRKDDDLGRQGILGRALQRDYK